MADHALQLDDWQKEVMRTTGNICLRSGRQVGKSTVISVKAAEYAIKNKNKNVMVVASVERQALLLFEKILSHIYNTNKLMIKKGKDRPTKHKINLTNGSVIHCLPTGESGYGIRGYTIHLLIADEAAFIPEEVWTAVTPMLAITQGDIWLLSTPHGREGYFYRCFDDDTFTSFHVSSEDCPRKNQKFLAHEKERMTKLQYTQEYLGEFVDELMQFFPTKLITQCQTAVRRRRVEGNREYFLGVDVARMGGDETTLEIVQRQQDRTLIHVENKTYREIRTTDCTRLILKLDKEYNFRKIYIDDGGLGVGVFDQLFETEEVRRKVVAINNAARSFERGDHPRKKKLLKEDLYNNLLNLMERGRIELLDDPEIYLSLKSIQFEYSDGGKLQIHGSYSHIAEGLIRSAWCVKDKTLNIYCY